MKLQRNWKRLRARNNHVEKAYIINLMGLSHGVGTTHFAIMLGTYLAKGRHCKVALIEYGQQGSFDKIQKEEKTKEVRLGINGTDRYAFSCHGMVFYSGIAVDSGIVRMLANYYDYIIVDMSVINDPWQSATAIGEWLSGQSSIAVISDAPWKRRACRQRLNRMMGLAGNCRIKVVSVNGGGHYRDIKVCTIPWEPNPFQIGAEIMPWMESMVE